MTDLAISTPAVRQRGSEWQRIWNVVRLHFVNIGTTIAVPSMIMGLIFLANLAIWAIIRASLAPGDRTNFSEGMQWSGSTFYIFVYMLVVAVQAISATFPFALGLSTTRRDYYLGTAASFILLSAGYAVALTLLSLLEEATNGWGLGGRMFVTNYFSDGPVLERFFVFFAVMLFFFFVGSIFASVWMRWRAYGVIVLGVLLAALLLGAMLLIGVTGSWGAVGDWLVSNRALGVAWWSLLPTALSAVAGFFLLRRVTPRN
ncbi:hypothetical protein [Ruicaihuangia caeni]|uniref:ABC transporter permease n=1 Tax=Ruicaihuangia caeni TaxID=3042517 RepID=A0AAW6T2I1_9MICO|nr:hypothetical protein [Klugiella sp. YN-L-19]MDI2097634.1 hypothetical protein [Klugiella sp. YN-L-19]